MTTAPRPSDAPAPSSKGTAPTEAGKWWYRLGGHDYIVDVHLLADVGLWVDSEVGGCIPVGRCSGTWLGRVARPGEMEAAVGELVAAIIPLVVAVETLSKPGGAYPYRSGVEQAKAVLAKYAPAVAPEGDED